MAAEWWDPPSHLRARLVACGHTFFKRDCPKPFWQDGREMVDCEACQNIQASTIVRDGVPSKGLAWGEARCTHRLKFRKQSQNQGHVKSIKSLLQAMSTPGTTHIELGLETLQLDRGLRNKGPVDGLVLRAWPAGCIVSGGTIHLPLSTVLLLTGHGVHFRGTTFSGGIIVCCGGGFSATFEACTFTECTLCAVHGATATLRRCALRTGFPAAVAHGAGTALHLHACTLEACMTDVTAERGATVTAAHCRSSGCITSLIARDAGTAMSCRDCCLSGVGQKVGVLSEGSRVQLRGCAIHNFERGAVADGRHAAMELHGCSVTAGIHPVISREGAAMLLRETQLLVRSPPGAGRPALRAGRSGAADAPAWLVYMYGNKIGRGAGAIQFERCTLSAPGLGGTGVTVRSGATATLHLCKVSTGGNAVIVCAQGRAVARLSHCSVQSTNATACYVEHPSCIVGVTGGRLQGQKCGALATNGGRLLMRDATAGGLLGAAATSTILVQLGGTAKLLRCALRNAQYGVLAVHASVSASDVTVSGLVNSGRCQGEESYGSAGFCQAGGKLSVVGGSVSGCATAVSVSSDLQDNSPDAGGSIPGAGYSTPVATDVVGVTFHGNGTDLHVCDDAEGAITAVRCDFRGSGSAAAARRVISGVMTEQVAVMASRCHAALTVQHSTFRGHRRDIFTDSCAIDVSGCTFLGGHGEGANLLLSGSGTVSDCRFKGAPGGIEVRGSSTSVHRVGVQGCVFEAAVVTGVLVSEGAQATVSACRFAGCKEAMRALQGTSLTVSDTECTGAETGVDVCGAAAVCAQRLTLTACEHGLAISACGRHRTAATLVECVATRATAGAIVIGSPGVEAHVRGCTLKGNLVGVSVVAGSSVRIVDTRVGGCSVGATIGVPQQMLSEPCGVCRRSGAPAVACALNALHAAGRAGVEGARCVHEGTVAIAVLEDVVMSDCILGLQVNGSGRVTARRLDVRGAEVAYSLTRVGARHVFKDCVASGGSQPAVRSSRVLGPEEQYRVVAEACAGIVVREGPPAPPHAARTISAELSRFG